MSHETGQNLRKLTRAKVEGYRRKLCLLEASVESQENVFSAHFRYVERGKVEKHFDYYINRLEFQNLDLVYIFSA